MDGSPRRPRRAERTAYRMYIFRTRAGVFSIVQRNGRWHLIVDGESLGSYPTAVQAADDLVGGHFSLPAGTDTATLGIPADLSEWEQTTADERTRHANSWR
jgi:hypothetical protein